MAFMDLKDKLFWLNKIIQFIKDIVHLNVGWWVHVGSTAVFAMTHDSARVSYENGMGRNRENRVPLIRVQHDNSTSTWKR